MSNASQRNFGAAMRERERRLGLALEGEGVIGLPVVSGDHAWDAFWGSLHDQEDAANAAGLNYRVDLGSIGRPYDSDYGRGGFGGRGFGSFGLSTPGGVNPLEADSLKYQALNRASDAEAQRVREEQAANDLFQQGQERERLANLATGYDQQAQAAMFAPPVEPSTITKDVRPGQPDRYTIRPTSTDPQQRYLDRLPLPARAQAMRQMADDALKQREMAVKEGNLDARVSGGAKTDDVALAVQAMREGTAPPQLPGRASKDYTAIMAEAKRQGYDLATAATDWQAAQKHFATLNGAQQTRIRQGIDTAYHSLDVIDQLADQWKGGRLPLLNAASLALAKNGAFGKDAQSIATQLDAQITDLTSELGNVYMGGNSPTDHALSLAGKNLSANWSNDVLKEMTALARKNLEIRRNSIANVGAIGASAQNPYVPSQAAASPAVAPAPAPVSTGLVEMLAPDGRHLRVPADKVKELEALGAKRKGG